MAERMLFPPTLAAISLAAHYEYPTGWRLRLACRFEGEADWRLRSSYSELETSEVLDVILAEVETLRVRPDVWLESVEGS